ncbi:MAG: VWA domain-containing protein, partial [Thermoanaerobaculia bacterium]
MKLRSKGMSPGFELARLALLAAVFAASLLGQAGSNAAESFGEQVDVEVVNVDVVVTDRSGRRVVDLKQDDFELRVDGRSTAIEYFSPPRGPGAQPSSAPLAAATIPDLPAPGTPATAATAPTSLVLYIDQTALETRARHETIEELREYFLARPDGADRVTVAVFEQNLQIVLPSTSDRALLMKALDTVESRPSLARLGSGERMQLDHEIRQYGQDVARFGGGFAVAEAHRIEQAIEQWAEEQIDRQRRSVAALQQMIGALAASEGRKAVLLATAGIQANPGQAVLAALDQQRGVATSSDANRAPTLAIQGLTLIQEFERMILAAQNARIAFYTISPVVQPPGENSAEFGSAGPNAYRPLPRDTGGVEAASSVARLAGATGGSTLTVGANLDRKLEAVAADIDAAYSLGFTTDTSAGDKDHRIEVTTRRAGLEVRHRENFRRRTAGERANSALAAAVTLGQAEN